MSPARKKRLTNNLCLFTSALAIGWMVGTSVSPVIHIVIASIVGLIVAVASLICGLNEKMPTEEAAKPDLLKNIAGINLLPLALLTVGLAIGSAFGIYGRTHNWLGGEMSKSDSAHIKCDTTNIKAMLNVAHLPVLYSIKGDACGALDLAASMSTSRLEAELKAVGDSAVVHIVETCKGDSSCLIGIKKIICTSAK